MKTFTTLSALQTHLAENIAEDATLSMAFLDTTFDGPDIAAIKEAGRICDRLIVVALTPKAITPEIEKYLESIRCPILFKLEAQPAKIEVKSDKAIITPLLQTILAIMPLLIVVPEKRTELVTCLRNIEDTFTQLFTLRIQK